MQTKLNLEDFFKEEVSRSSDFLAIVEEDNTNPAHVKITPCQMGGCKWSNSLSVSKDSIDSVEKKEYTHFCCGQNHKVVKVNFKKDAVIGLANVIKEINPKPQTASVFGQHGILGSDFAESPIRNVVTAWKSLCRFSGLELRLSEEQAFDPILPYRPYRAVAVYKNTMTGKTYKEIKFDCFWAEL